MAYYLHHTCIFKNPLNEQIRVELHKKDVEPEEVTTLLATSFRGAYPKGEGDKFDPIIAMEAVLTIWLQTEDSATFDDFIVTFPDEWKLIAYADDHIIFVGFLTPGEGRAEFQDKPHEVTLSATDGLGLLKGIPLTDDDEEKFTGVNLVIDYILAILNKTGLDLNVRVISSIVEESMQDRTENSEADTFNQTGLHARTFLKNAIEFNDCYKCLEIILSEYFSVYQWNGRWVVLRIGEMQVENATFWYTDYDNTGTILGADQSIDNACAVGRDRVIHPTDASQFIGSEFALRLVRYTYNYNPWPELPTNNNFEYGTLLSEVTNPDGTITREYSIDGWLFGGWSGFPSQLGNLPALSPAGGTARAYKKVTFNAYGVEIAREIWVGGDPTQTDVILQSDAIPVKSGDKIEIGIDFRKNFASGGTFNFLAVYIKPSAGPPFWSLDNNNSTDQDGGPVFWTTTGTIHFLSRFYDGEDVEHWRSITIEPPSMPVDGDLYIWFLATNPNAVNFSVYRNFQFTYRPFVAGGYVQVTGDYAQTSQDVVLKDKVEEEVYISDSLKKVLKGSLYRENLTDLTTPTWHRFNVDEQRHFKELGELARYNSAYRRMWKINGSFDGLLFQPDNNPLVIEPISFHRQFTFPDRSELKDHYFMLVPPLTIYYNEGRAEMNFVECFKTGDGNQEGDNHIPLNYIFS